MDSLANGDQRDSRRTTAASSIGFFTRSRIPDPAKTSVILVTLICDLESGAPRLTLTVRQQGHSSE
jgi:hypothetical protein